MDKESFEKRKKVINDLIHDKIYVPMKAKEIAMLLNIPKEQRPELQEVLDALILEGKIGISKKGKYGKAENTSLTGIFESTQKGFGFVTVEGEPEDIYIAEKDTNGAFHHDTVSVIITREGKDGKHKEGKILRVIEHKITQVVGLYEDNGGYGFVVPDNQRFTSDIFIPKNMSLGAVDGHKVVAEIRDYGDAKRNPEGKVVKIIGHKNDPGTDILSIVEDFGIPTEYPEAVMEQAAQIPDTVSKESFEGRLDLRDVTMVTIDGEDAKDLDDAVSLSKEGDIYHLGVHIADVSEYVREKTPLDEEALRRGTSVYLVDRVIPMLPHKLSNGICSLNEGVDRLALSCLMDIDEKGNIVGHRICETVVRVDRRMTYTAVKEILTDQKPETIAAYRELVPMFTMMAELAGKLRSKRHQRGSIDFDFPESRILLNDRGVPVSIQEYDRNIATKMIEDFMLAANETVAEDYFWQELPFVYRTHEKPDPEKIQSLGIFINNFGYTLHVSDREIHPKEMQKLLEKVEGSQEEALINRLVLRSMKRAMYTQENTGHFGLAAKYYTHFTSPIRRYPDLQIHRIIKENLHGGVSEKRKAHYDAILPVVCKETSSLERRADEAEREVEKLKKAEYMSHHIGESFEGVISGVTAWGIYVELQNTVEGLVHVTALEGDYFHYDEPHCEMVGETTKKTYRLGERVRVVCTGTDKLQKTIDFKFQEND